MNEALAQLAAARLRALDDISAKHTEKLWHDQESERIGDDLALMYAHGQAHCGLSSGDIARATGLRPERVSYAIKVGRALLRTRPAPPATEGGPATENISQLPVHIDPSNSGRTYGEAGGRTERARLAAQPGASA